jgi:dephospho-CoA kinase
MGAASYVIGLTGNIATGKSTVARMLADLGATFIDADAVAHRVIAPDGEAFSAVVAEFGPQILADDGTIDRRALGQIVFADPQALQHLERLVHPAVIDRVNRQIAEGCAAVVVVEAIKLLESGMAETYDAIWVTTCSPETQLERLVRTRDLSPETALARIRSQPSQAEKVARADVVINTEGSRAATRALVAEAWRALPT